MVTNIPMDPANDFELTATASLKDRTGLFQRMLEKQSESAGDTAKLSETHEIILVIRGYPEYFRFERTSALVLGRMDDTQGIFIHIDLTCYGAESRGVSRVHAQIAVAREKRLYVTDLDSTNGTFLCGKRLKPYMPYLLHNGDTLILGRLPMQVYTRAE